MDAGTYRSYLWAIAGGLGGKYEPIMERIKKSPRAKSIRCLGYTHDDKLPALYAGASAFVVTSHYEGFGFPILEAQQAGIEEVRKVVTMFTDMQVDFTGIVRPGDRVITTGRKVFFRRLKLRSTVEMARRSITGGGRSGFLNCLRIRQFWC